MDATKQNKGVSEEQENKNQKPNEAEAKQADQDQHVDERADFIEQLALKSKQERGDEVLENAEETPGEEAADDPNKETPTENQKPNAEEAVKPDENDDEPKEQFEEIIVDGKLQKVPLSKIHDAGKRALQKESAADQRLEEATRLLKEAKNQRLSNQDAKKPDDDQGKNDQSGNPDPIEEKRLAYIHATQYGTAEEASTAMKEWEDAVTDKIIKNSGASNATPIDTETIKREIRNDTRAEEIYNKFSAEPDQGGFNDLLDDSFGTVNVPNPQGGMIEMPTLQFMVSQEADRLVKAGETKGYGWDTFKKAGEIVRAKFVKPQSSDGFNDKRKKKEQIDNITPAGSRQNVDTDTNQNQYKSDDDRYQAGFQEIAAGRGG